MANANTFKRLGSNDIVSTRTLLHEAIPLTGTIVSGTYNNNNVKFHSHGMFQTVYDYPYLSSSANNIFDLTVGVSSNSSLYSRVSNQQLKKRNIYNQMAQVLVGYDITGSTMEFDEDGNILAGGSKLREVFVMSFSRLLVKDEIKKGTFNLELGIDPVYQIGAATFSNRILLTDHSGSDGFLVNSPVGEYGVLFATASNDPTSKLLKANRRFPVGLLYYQAGIAVITASVFTTENEGGIMNNAAFTAVSMSNGPDGTANGKNTINQILTGSEISGACDNFRTRIYNISFNNTTELNSSIYFCRLNNNEYNYSSNPTYLNNSKIRVKTNASDDPRAYITGIGLYSSDKQLMAVAKLSEPLEKTPSNEFTLRVRLDY